MWCELDDWIDVLRCPADGARLQRTKPSNSNTNGESHEPDLFCEKCDRRYPVTEGIPRFIGGAEASTRDWNIKKSEMEARDAVAEQYDGQFATRRNAIEIPPCLAAMRPGARDVVVELGCGTGRLTLQYAPLVERVVAMDFSLRSLLVLRKRMPKELQKKSLLIQADVCTPPLARRFFTKAVSFQVFEHLPSATARQQAASAVSELLAPGGSFTCTVYNWSKAKQRDAARGIGDNTYKDGFHDSNIYYYNFEESELRAMLHAAGMQVEWTKGLVIALRGSRLLGPLLLPMNRLLSSTRWGIRRSHLLLARARPISQ